MKELSRQKNRLRINYHPAQRDFLFESPARFKVVAKGRRFGLTRGVSQYFIESLLEDGGPILWLDTTQSNTVRYVERYWYPVLRQLDPAHRRYRQQKLEINVAGHVCDFRGADRPENIEGFGYKKIFINEAGIVFKKPHIWTNSVLPMILDYGAECIIGGAPKGKKHKGKEALFFTLFKKAKARSGGVITGQSPRSVLRKKLRWQAFRYTTYDNPYLSRTEIRDLEAEMSATIRIQELMARFIEQTESEIIKAEWWNYYTELPMKKPMLIVQVWDTAHKKGEEHSFSVCETWFVYPEGYYLVDVWRKRAEFPELKRQVKLEHQKHSPNVVVVEDKASGISLIQEIKSDTTIPIKPFKVDRDKVARAHSVSPTIEAGNCYLPENASWVSDFVDEHSDFPSGEFDDQVDSTTIFLNYMRPGRTSIPRAKSRPRAKRDSMIERM